MTILKARAPAKVNLMLHVTSRREDGYHELDSLVVFADTGDHITVRPAETLQLTVTGPFAAGVPTDHANLVIKAAQLLQNYHNTTLGAQITLDKQLPNAAGIGGGSSDAATTLTLLSQLWGVAPIPAPFDDLQHLGADVPVCMMAPRPARMSGIGEKLEGVGKLPSFALVLVNSQESASTKSVFGELETSENLPMTEMPKQPHLDDFIEWLKIQRNDLLQPATATAPTIPDVLKKLQLIPSVKFAGMSGSGSTCFGIVQDMAEARKVARMIQVSEINWWVVPAEVLS